MKKLKLLIIVSLLCGCASKPQEEPNIYADVNQWVYLETEVEGKDADVFFINPTVYMGDEENLNWLEYDETTTASFIGAINMEKGIYDDNARFFSPYYHQASLAAYYADSTDAFDIAFNDVKEAFEYYLENYNEGRPIVLAGFSQGAQMCIRLLKEYSNDEEFNKLLVACYAIGWRFTQEEQEEYPNLHFAQGETDTGVIIAFNSEDPSIENSLLIPEGTKTMAMNPLNWTTDNTVADRSYNLGACFTDYDGNIVTEIPLLTGAYIDENRGALKVTDIDREDFPAILFEDGIYHIYDYQFFYRNLEKNVQDRIEAYLE